MKIVKSLNDFSQIALGTTLYRVTRNRLEHYYYGGINPKSNKSIMLISSGNINTIHGEYIGDDELANHFLLDYDDACQKYYEKALENVDIIKRIYIDKNYK